MLHARFFPRPIRQIAAWLVALAASLVLALPAQAQGGDGRAARFGDANIAVRLHAEGQPVEGQEWLLALRFTPRASEWHGYWSNPGDAGAGMQLSLDLPPDWEVGEARYPVPRRLLVSGLMNHIYEGPYTVLVPVKPGPSVKDFAGPVTGRIEYLACTDQICVPQDAVLEARPGGDFARWRASVAPLLESEARFAIRGRTLRIAIPLPETMALSDPHVFIANERLVAYAAPQTFRRDGDLLVAEIPLDDYGTGKAAALSGILAFGDGEGVRFTAAVGPVPSGGEVIAGPQRSPAPMLWTLILGALAGGCYSTSCPASSRS